MLVENPLMMIPSDFEFDRDEKIPVKIKPYLQSESLN